MDDYLPLFSCILVTSVLIGCCLRYRRSRHEEPAPAEYSVLSTVEQISNAPISTPFVLGPLPTAPSMQRLDEETDPIV